MNFLKFIAVILIYWVLGTRAVLCPGGGTHHMVVYVHVLTFLGMFQEFWLSGFPSQTKVPKLGAFCKKCAKSNQFEQNLAITVFQGKLQH